MYRFFSGRKTQSNIGAWLRIYKVVAAVVSPTYMRLLSIGRYSNSNFSSNTLLFDEQFDARRILIRFILTFHHTSIHPSSYPFHFCYSWDHLFLPAVCGVCFQVSTRSANLTPTLGGLGTFRGGSLPNVNNDNDNFQEQVRPGCGI